MKKKVLYSSVAIIVIIILIIIFSYLSLQNPTQDFTNKSLFIEYSRVCGECPPENTRVMINSEGLVKITQAVGALMVEYELNATRGEVLEIVNTAQKKGFFEMDETNINENLFDEPGDFVSITVDGEIKSVLVIGYDWAGFDEIVRQIRAISIDKKEIPFFSNPDLIKKCETLSNICPSKETSFDCDQAISYCNSFE